MVIKMNTETVLSLFTLFSGVKSPVDYSAVTEPAIGEVGRMLRSDADSSDERLCYLAAALAAKRTAEILSIREKTALTQNGAVSLSEDFSKRLKNAEEFFLQMKAVCADLINDSGFVFSIISED